MHLDTFSLNDVHHVRPVWLIIQPRKQLKVRWISAADHYWHNTLQVVQYLVLTVQRHTLENFRQIL